MSNILSTPEISIDEFKWDKQSRRFLADASDIPWLRLGRVYSDSIDMGFTLVNPVSGKYCRLVEANEERNEDGDVISREFIPADMAERRSLGFSVLIFND